MLLFSGRFVLLLVFHPAFEATAIWQLFPSRTIVNGFQESYKERLKQLRSSFLVFSFFGGLWPPTLPWFACQAQPLQLTPVQGKKTQLLAWMGHNWMVSLSGAACNTSRDVLAEASLDWPRQEFWPWMRDGGEGLMALDVVSRWFGLETVNGLEKLQDFDNIFSNIVPFRESLHTESPFRRCPVKLSPLQSSERQWRVQFQMHPFVGALVTCRIWPCKQDMKNPKVLASWGEALHPNWMLECCASFHRSVQIPSKKKFMNEWMTEWMMEWCICNKNPFVRKLWRGALRNLPGGTDSWHSQNCASLRLLKPFATGLVMFIWRSTVSQSCSQATELRLFGAGAIVLKATFETTWKLDMFLGGNLLGEFL